MSSILDSSMSNKSLARSIVGTDPEVLKDIYIEDINIVTWQRKLSHLIADASESVMNSNSALQYLKSLLLKMPTLLSMNCSEHRKCLSS